MYSSGQTIPCSNNYSASIDANPALYLSLVTESLNIGLQSYEITSEQSKVFTSSFSQKVITENKVTAGAEFNVNGIIKAFNIGAKTSLEFVSMTRAEKATETTTAKSWATTIKGSYNLKEDQLFFTAAEMKLYVFTDHEGARRKLSLPTGRLQNGAFTRENLNNWILDKSFEGLMRTSGWQLPTFSLDQIEDHVRARSDIPKLPRAPFPDPSLYYNIENARYPGSWLYGRRDIGCSKKWHHAEDQKWRFQPDGNVYFIYNKHNKYHRLTGLNNKDLVFYDGSIYDDQKWRVTPIEGNKVRLTNYSNGGKLAQPSRDHCVNYIGATYDDQIWKLIVA